MLICLYAIYGFSSTTAELKSGNRDHMAPKIAKPKIVTIWPCIENVC